MQKYYRFGQLIMALREEYSEYKHLLDELETCISINNSNNYYFTGYLSDNGNPEDFSDRRIKLVVEKDYLKALKILQFLKYNWYSKFLYTASFNAEKKYSDLYGLYYNNILTPCDKDKYIPMVKVIDQVKFTNLIDELCETDVMKLKKGYFGYNHDLISLDFNSSCITTKLGDNSIIRWNGINDNIIYSVNKHYSPSLIESILSLQIPEDRISEDWLVLLKKHENILEKELYFDVDIEAQSKKGVLRISDIEKRDNLNVIKLTRRNNKETREI